MDYFTYYNPCSFDGTASTRPRVSYDDAVIEEAMVGRKIVHADNDTLTLDDGTVLEIRGNEGCGGCPDGHYEVSEFLSKDNIPDNIITSVDLNSFGEQGEEYAIYVFAENTRINVATFSGDDGNGCYGAGYSILVRKAVPATV